MQRHQREEDFNRQLAEKLKFWLENHPNHIPVYMMKYQTASDYLIEDVKEPLALYPKKFKLNTLYELIQKESLEFCKQKYRESSNLTQKDFKIDFFLYTIKMDASKPDSTQPPGKFVKLDLNMTIGEAYQKYGRENCLTIVYTNAQEISFSRQKDRYVEKFIYLILGIILLLVVGPMLIGEKTEISAQPLSAEPVNDPETISMHSELFDFDSGDSLTENRSHQVLNFPELKHQQILRNVFDDRHKGHW